jgi:hypothetical protein
MNTGVNAALSPHLMLRPWYAKKVVLVNVTPPSLVSRNQLSTAKQQVVLQTTPVGLTPTSFGTPSWAQ